MVAFHRRHRHEDAAHGRDWNYWRSWPRIRSTIAVIVVTAQGTIDSAVQAMRMGAYDYITKPIDTNRLRTILQNAMRPAGDPGQSWKSRAAKLRDSGSLGSLVGASKQDAGDFSSHRDGGPEHGLRAHHRSQRHRQGDGRAHDS